MLNTLIHWFIVAASVLLTSRVIRGVEVAGWGPAFFAAFVLGALNLLVKPLLILLTLPLTIVTLGLFLLVVNALVLKLAGALVPGFRVRGFWAAVFAALLISIFSGLGDALVDRAGWQRLPAWPTENDQPPIQKT